MSKPVVKPAKSARIFNIVALDGAIPIIQLFGEIGESVEPDPWWGGEGGAGTFKEFDAELRKLGNVPELKIEIHSYGGSVMVGQAIHDKLREHPAKKTAYIYGVCASAATYPALACDTVKIPANAYFLIHSATSWCAGNASDLRAAAESLELIDNSLADFYAKHTGKTSEEMLELMHKDTWLSGREAVELGLANEVIEPVAVDAKPVNLAPNAIKNMPAAAKCWFDNAALLSNRNRIPTNLTMPTNPPPAPAKTAPANDAPAPTPAAPAVPAPVNNNPVPAAEPTLADVLAEMKNLAEKVDRIDNYQKQGIANLGGTAPISGVVPGTGEGGGAPTNKTELEAALKAASNFAERREILKNFDERNKKG